MKNLTNFPKKTIKLNEITIFKAINNIEYYIRDKNKDI
jgi:hypothetical protein